MTVTSKAIPLDLIRRFVCLIKRRKPISRYLERYMMFYMGLPCTRKVEARQHIWDVRVLLDMPREERPPYRVEYKKCHISYTSFSVILCLLEEAEATVLMALGMYAPIVMLMALVSTGGHVITTTDGYRKILCFIETVLPKMGITTALIDPTNVGALESALEQNNVNVSTIQDCPIMLNMSLPRGK